MLLEDDNPVPVGPPKPKNLDSMSVGDLEEYVEALKAEIQRAEAEKAKKSATRAAAEAIFGKK